MGVWLKVVLGLVLTFLALKAGWPWPIVVLPGYLALLTFITPPPPAGRHGNNASTARGTLLSLSMVLAITAFTAWLIEEMLRQVDVSAKTAGGRLYAFFFGVPELQIFWALVCALLVAYVAWTFVLTPLVTGQGLTGQASGSSIFTLAVPALGDGRAPSKGTLTVSGGTLAPAPGTNDAVVTSGGPADLVVQEGHAVILERYGRTTRIVASGAHRLQPAERVSMIVPLYTRQERIELKHVATKDQVLLDEINLLIFHRLDASPTERALHDGRFPYSEEQIIKAWNARGSDWQGAVRSIAQNVSRDVFGRFELKELVPLSAHRHEIMQRIRDEISQTTQRFGVIISTVDIGEIKISAEIERQLQEQWAARIRGDIDQMLEAKHRQERILTTEGIIQTLRSAMGRDPSVREMVALRFIEYLEEKTNDKNAGEVDDIGLLLKLQGMETLDSLPEV